MKASELIAVLAKEIQKHGDKRVLCNSGNGGWYELTMTPAGRFYGQKPFKEQRLDYTFFDLDLI